MFTTFRQWSTHSGRNQLAIACWGKYRVRACKGKIESGPRALFAFRPNSSPMAFYNVLHCSKANTRPLKSISMKPVKRSKKSMGIGHIETHAVVLHVENGIGFTTMSTEFNLWRGTLASISESPVKSPMRRFAALMRSK